MTEHRSFESRVKNEVEAERRQQKAIRDQEKSNARQVKAAQQRSKQGNSLRAAKLLRHEGTKPGEIWSGEDLAACNEFLQYMAKIGFKGARTLQSDPIKGRVTKPFLSYSEGDFLQLGGFQTRGYAIGHVRQPTDYTSRIGTKTPSRDVLLCVDGELRTPVRLHTRTKGLTGLMGGREGHDIYTDLPMNSDGRVVVPSIVDSEVTSSREWYDSGRASFEETHYTEKFYAVLLEDRLTEIAKHHSL